MQGNKVTNKFKPGDRVRISPNSEAYRRVEEHIREQTFTVVTTYFWSGVGFNYVSIAWYDHVAETKRAMPIEEFALCKVEG